MPAMTRIFIGCLLAVTCFIAPASACSRSSFMIFFDFGSADLNNSYQKATLEQFQRVVALGLPPKCSTVTVFGTADTAEAAIPESRLGIARAEVVRDAMVHAGYPKAAIQIEGFMGTKLLVPTGPGVREPQNRRVEFDWVYGKGRWRCDSAVERPMMGTCGRGTNSCYWELTDGTICNFHMYLILLRRNTPSTMTVRRSSSSSIFRTGNWK